MGGELRRSYTQMDFSLNRVNIRPHMHHMFQSAPIQVRDPRRRYSAMPANKVKHPTLDIYRPPSIRPRQEGFNGMAATQRSLNVHAPEFTMNPIQTSRSTSSMMMNMNGFGMMGQGFAKGPMVHQGNNVKGHVPQPHPMAMGLQMSKSSGNVLHQTQAVAPNNINQAAPRAVHFQEPTVVATAPKPSGSGLKRSKSLTATDTLRASTSPILGQSADMGQFTPDVQADLQQAIKDPNELSARSLMTLAKQIVERATNDRRYAEPAAKICINVIEKEQKETFLESLINTCQLSYQERDRVLRANPSARRYRQYMTFLNEMYVQLKRSQLQLKTQYDGVPPQKLLLTLLSKCFVDCLQAKPLFKIEQSHSHRGGDKVHARLLTPILSRHIPIVASDRLLTQHAVLSIVLVKSYNRVKKYIQCLQEVSSKDNEQVLNNASNNDNYVMISGPIKALGNTIPSVYVPNTYGVVQKLSTSDLVLARNSSGFWLDESRPIHQSYNVVPFAILNGKIAIEVQEVLLADELHLDTVYNKYERTVHTLAGNVWSLFFGVRQYGVQTTEEMLKEGTVISAIGDLSLSSDGSRVLLPPSGGKPYFITSLPLSSLFRDLNNKKSLFGTLLFVTGGLTVLFGGLLARRLWCYLKKRRAKLDRQRRLDERRRTHRRDTHDEDLPDSLRCVICQENPKEIIMLPCGHLCSCEDCSEQLGSTCPICRAHVVTKAAAFLS